jgi:hypothetical protein
MMMTTKRITNTYTNKESRTQFAKRMFILLIAFCCAMRRLNQDVDVRYERKPIRVEVVHIQRPDKSIDYVWEPTTTTPAPTTTTTEIRKLPANKMECLITTDVLEVLNGHTFYFVETNILTDGSNGKRREVTTYCVDNEDWLRVNKTYLGYWVACRKCDLEHKRFQDAILLNDESDDAVRVIIFVGLTTFVVVLVFTTVGILLYHLIARRHLDKIAVLREHAQTAIVPPPHYPTSRKQKTTVDVTQV